MRTKILATGTNNSIIKYNAGFTLIELLVVVMIVGIMTSLVTLSVDLAKPSAVKSLKVKIQSHIVSVQNHSQLYNKPIRLIVHSDKIQSLTLNGPSWKPSKVLPILEFDSVAVSSDVNTIEVLPNGFITPASITLSKDDESSVINTKTNER
ncbi:prepilin-type N-terminal cleavage/methylation domain-containing protein [bacterium endosymbiont of Bathymodiolus sp. 5 South]|uniref:prepilin-type N-terminal cleavage/methylation domain-containing protein n=1 Tax=bacterium endosymbiont of Bathymodiolus sp. 5 South TaxID=1181670 RepID=UPI00111A940F|nr:prepilin-type N-terminal cleavage/methylation domain-containing protein [bacterium endosymbiont of Bathymodiolus sp. 5 South]